MFVFLTLAVVGLLLLLVSAFGGHDTLVLERLPEVIRAFAPVAVAAPLGNIDKVVLVDTGSAEQPTLARYASTVPATLFQTVQAAQALGLDLSGLLGRLGVAPAGDGKTPPLAEVRPVAEPKEAGGGKPR
jgi:hypothetical protein